MLPIAGDSSSTTTTPSRSSSYLQRSDQVGCGVRSQPTENFDESYPGRYD
jgi:hypothetical protein